MSPGWSMKLKATNAWMRPMAMPAKKARRNDTMPAMTAAASARTSVLGPSVARSVAEPDCAAMRLSDSVASAPAMAHTIVDTRFGLIPERRARSGFSADAVTLLPRVVGPMNQLSAMATTRTINRIESWAPVILTDPHWWAEAMAWGNGAPALSMSGNELRMASESCATPIVATSTITR